MCVILLLSPDYLEFLLPSTNPGLIQSFLWPNNSIWGILFFLCPGFFPIWPTLKKKSTLSREAHTGDSFRTVAGWELEAPCATELQLNPQITRWDTTRRAPASNVGGRVAPIAAAPLNRSSVLIWGILMIQYMVLPFNLRKKNHTLGVEFSI